MVKKFATIFVFLSASLAMAQDCEQYLGSCDFYQCMNSNLGCRPNNYLVKFGFNRCNKFSETQSTYSTIGQDFMNQVRECLQVELLQNKKLNCTNVRKNALDSHVICYQKAGYCELPYRDRVKIGMTVLSDLLQADFIIVANKINFNCVNEGHLQ